MKKLVMFLLGIFVLGQSFVMADLIGPNGEAPSAKGPDFLCMIENGSYIFGICIKEQTKQYIIIFVLFILLICGTFLYLRNRKLHTDDKPVS